MTISKIEAVFEEDIKVVWDLVTSVENYSWRSDLREVKLVNKKEFIEYTKDNFETRFIVTKFEPYQVWEFNMENKNIRGKWTGNFFEEDGKTRVEFIEDVQVKNILMQVFIKSYLRKQQKLFIRDLKKALEEN